MKGLSLSKFKKMREDKDWATLIHEDGHSLNIAKAPLSPIQRKQIEKLEMVHQNDQHFDEGGQAQSQAPLEITPVDDQGNDLPNTPAPASSDNTAQNTPQNVPEQSTAPHPQQPQDSNPLSQAVLNGQPYNIRDAQIPALTEQKTANLGIAQAAQLQAERDARTNQRLAQQTAALPTQNDYVKAYNESDAQLGQLFQDRTIKPDHYWENHSKVPSAIGVILSSLGQGIGVGRVPENAGLQALRQHINDDIDAQKNNQNQALTLWKMNREALGNNLAADLATKNQLWKSAQYEIAQHAAESAGAAAVPRAQFANAQIDAEIQKNNFERSLLNPSSDNPNPATRVNYVVQDPAQKPQVLKEIGEATNMVNNWEGIKDAFWKASHEVRPVSGGLNTSLTAFVPGSHSANQKAFLAQIAPTIQEQEGTARQVAFDNVEHNMLPQFGDNDETIATKWAALSHYARSKSAAPFSNANHLDLTRFPSTNTRALNVLPPGISEGQAMATGNENRATASPSRGYERKVYKVNGVDKAYMVPVK